MISNIDITIDINKINFLTLIIHKTKFLSLNHKDKITSFHSNFKFYILTDSRSQYILAIKRISDINIIKIRYSLSGVVISNISDTLSDNSCIIRSHGNKTIIIKDDKIISYKQYIPLNTIVKPEVDTNAFENNNIGVIDCETYSAEDDITKIYALGFKTNLDPVPKIYYIGQDFDS